MATPDGPTVVANHAQSRRVEFGVNEFGSAYAAYREDGRRIEYVYGFGWADADGPLLGRFTALDIARCISEYALLWAEALEDVAASVQREVERRPFADIKVRPYSTIIKL